MAIASGLDTYEGSARLAIFASGGGSNFRAIAARVDSGELENVRLELLVTNNSRCGAAEYAHWRGMCVEHISAVTHPAPAALEARMLGVLEEHRTNLMVLAGYMKRLPPAVIRRYRGRILNIHPALLPRFGGRGMYGLRVHEAVLRAGARESGVTVHLVTEEYDAGEILAQVRVPVLPGDTAESLQERVLGYEHDLYWRVIDSMVNGPTDD